MDPAPPPLVPIPPGDPPPPVLRPEHDSLSDCDEQRHVPTLETLAMDRYLAYLESECCTYVSLSQTRSLILKGLCDRLLRFLKTQLSARMTGLASSVIREKMLSRILGGEFPTERHSFRNAVAKRVDPSAASLLSTQITSIVQAPLSHNHQVQCAQTQALQALGGSCTSPCCTGSFIQETMAGVVLNSDVREIMFTTERMSHILDAAGRLNPDGTLASSSATPDNAAFVAEFNVSLVLSHLLESTHGYHSQLKRLVFSESFVKEEDSVQPPPSGPLGGNLVEGSLVQKCRDLMLQRVKQRQDRFGRMFAPRGVVGCSALSIGHSDHPGEDEDDDSRVTCASEAAARVGDRRGVTLNLLALFRNVTPCHKKFYRLTELTLKNNIQCDLYSKANFQFEFLARVGYSCPNLKVLDLFGTDTWADCLVAFFFRDAFHSLHRYLFFMENEEDETSGYHPHDLNRYCQFCLDQLHPNMVERPFTVNPVIPLLDDIYDHVIKKYPKRSYCILRNCVKVSELLMSVKSNVYELVRRDNMAEFVTSRHKSFSDGTESNGDDKAKALDAANGEETERSKMLKRLRPRGRVELPKRQCNSRLTRISSRKPRETLSQSEDSNGDKNITMALRRPSASRPSDNRRNLKHFNLKMDISETGKNTSGPRLLPPASLPTVITRSRKRKLVEIDAGLKEDFPTPVRKSSRRRQADPLLVAVASCKSKRNSRVTEARGKRERKRRRTGSPTSKIGSKSPGVAIKSNDAPRQEELFTMSFEEWEKRNSACYCGTDENCYGRLGHSCEPSSSNPSSMSEVLTQTLSGRHTRCKSMQRWNNDADWVEPEFVQYRQISGWPHLNECVRTLEVLNIGGTNVLGEFIPFVLLNCPRLKSLGQWLNTSIYGLEILRKLQGQERAKFPGMMEISYSTDRNYFCQPYIGFVPESKDFLNVRKEMIRMSGRLSKRINNSRKLDVKRGQVREDLELVVDACPCIRKLNLVVHYKNVVLEDEEEPTVEMASPPNATNDKCPWYPLTRLEQLSELDLVTMRFANVRSLLTVVGPSLTTLTLEMGEEQGVGSEIVHLGRSCPNLRVLKLILGDNILKGEMTLHFGSQFFRKLEHLTVEGSIHLHAFAFLWGHCRRLRYMRVGLVISNELTSTNMLIHDVFTLLFQVNAMSDLEEFHVRNLKIRSLQMGKFLLDSLPKLKFVSNWLLDLSPADVVRFRNILNPIVSNGLKIQYREW